MAPSGAPLRLVMEKCTSGDSFSLFDEAEAIEVLQSMAGRRCPDLAAELKAEAEYAKSEAKLCLAKLDPIALDQKPAEVVQQVAEVEDSDSDNDDRTPTFIISEGRARGRNCLHAFGGCYRARKLSFRSFDLVYDAVPPTDLFDVVCSVCWPRGAATKQKSEDGLADEDVDTDSVSSCASGSS